MKNESAPKQQRIQVFKDLSNIKPYKILRLHEGNIIDKEYLQVKDPNAVYDTAMQSILLKLNDDLRKADIQEPAEHVPYYYTSVDIIIPIIMLPKAVDYISNFTDEYPELVDREYIIIGPGCPGYEKPERYLHIFSSYFENAYGTFSVNQNKKEFRDPKKYSWGFN
jgi:hypothetical protein